MEILKYTNDQYAGMTGQEVNFQPGMNVILGDNETGKSTMITGLYDTLFMHSKLDGRKDKEFTTSRFPTGGGTSIDGEIRLVLDGQQVTIKKEWDKNNSDFRTVLVTQSGGKSTGTAAEKKIAELLAHGLGVYDNIVFGRQNNESAILDWYFAFMDSNPGKNAGEDVASARKKVSEAFSAVSGISEEVFERKLNKKLDELGSHWDFSRQGPEGGKGLRNRWKKEVGQILQAYYDLEERRQAADEARRDFSEWEETKVQLDSLRQKRAELEKKARELQTQESSAALMGTRQSLETEIKRLETALKAWPELAKEWKNLFALKQESDEQKNRTHKRELGQQIEKINELQGQRAELLKLAEPLHDIEQDDKACRRALSDAENLRSRLQSSKLRASVKMQSGYTAQLTTATGETFEITTRLEQNVDGFAKIEIPGVGKITVAPQSLDIAETEKQMQACADAAKEILGKYGADSLGGLEEKGREFQDIMKRIGRIEKDLVQIPGYDNVEGLESERDDIAVHEDVRVREDLEEAVRKVLENCREDSLLERIAVAGAALRGYESEHGTVANLAGQVESQRKKLDEISAKLDTLPPFTLTVEEFERQKRETYKQLNGLDGSGGVVKEIEKRIGELRVKEASLDDVNIEEMNAEIQALEQEFEHNKKLHVQYSKIKEDFLRLKAAQGDQFEAFYDQFNEYLGIVTGGQVQFEDGSTLKSGNNWLTTKELLSRGTKQTILLAFRLALLKFYYQNEPGVIVLDDTLLDMDPGRREKSVRLLQEFAKGNQVIFTTCDPGIAEMLGGNLVEFE